MSTVSDEMAKLQLMIDELEPHMQVVRPLTNNEYQLIQSKDPYTIYVITDRDTMYYGDTLIERDFYRLTYVMGIDSETNEYIIFKNLSDGKGADYFCEVRRYSDVNKAINDLRMSTIGQQHKVYYGKWTSLLHLYINNELTLHNLLIGIISSVGYDNDPLFQHIVQKVPHEISANWDESENKLERMYKHLYNLIWLHSTSTWYNREHSLKLKIDDELLNNIDAVIVKHR